MTIEWGVQKYGANLIINGDIKLLSNNFPTIIDVEDDENGHFVGIGLTQDGKNIVYRTVINTDLLNILPKLLLIGHNIKYDAKQLNSWGIKINPSQLFNDTILMSYVINSTKESQALKDLGKERGYIWPTYKELVGKGKLKKTLDKQNIETVANYNAMDVLITWKLYQEFKQKMNPFQTRILEQIELPVMRVLFEMEQKGALIDEEKLKQLNIQFVNSLETLKQKLLFFVKSENTKKEFNPNSNKQIATILRTRGFTLPRTPKGNEKVDKWTLERFKEDEFVKILLEYNKIEKLVSTYIGGLLERKTLPKIYPSYNQISKTQEGMDKGISTGRLSCSNPNLQQIPVKTEEGKLIRELFIPEKTYLFIDADYSQIEYRLLAHFTKEPVLIQAFKENKDVHEETGKILGTDRDTGKTLNFAAIYGAGSKKIARTAKITKEEADNFLQQYWTNLPRVTSWINQVKYQAKQQGGVYTLMKRWIPLPGLYSSNLYERYHWERCAVNFIIQGSAAEILKMAMISLRKEGYLPLLTVHDELLFECKECDTTAHSTHIKNIMESVLKLDIPLLVDIGIGQNWREAKGD
jgi:DNA polymerase-1